MKGKGVTEEEAVVWGAGGVLMRLMGKRVELNDESVCEFAMAFSKTQLVESSLFWCSCSPPKELLTKASETFIKVVLGKVLATIMMVCTGKDFLHSLVKAFISIAHDS